MSKYIKLPLKENNEPVIYQNKNNITDYILNCDDDDFQDILNTMISEAKKRNIFTNDDLYNSLT
jgi:hypothetical protein